MYLIESKRELQIQLRDWRAAGDQIALVPTMGNLHAGHTSLVDLAMQHADRVVVTVFVNPTQFGEHEDFDSYPRTIQRDSLRLKKTGSTKRSKAGP